MAESCYHCGESIPQGLKISAEINGEERFFCCHACLGVAELIQGSGLAQYYNTRSSASERPAERVQQQRWRSYDIPEVAHQYVYYSAPDSAEVYLSIEGIHCPSCAWLIQHALERKLNLQDVRINASTARGEIHWNPQNCKLSDILIAIAEIGYTPALLNPTAQDALFSRQRQKSLMRIIVAGLGSMQVMMFAVGLYFSPSMGMESQYANLLKWVSLIVASVVYFYSGLPFTLSALRSLRQGYVNMDVPIALALAGTYFPSVYHTLIHHGDIYFESVSMFIFFILIGRHLELITRHKAALNQQQFAKLLPDVVYRLDDSGTQTLIPLPTVQVGNLLHIPATFTIPVDGIIRHGSTRVDESMLSGESTPLYKSVGDRVLAGSSNLSAPIDLEVSATGQATILAGISRMIEQARQLKSPLIEKTDALARWTVLSILILAALGYLVWWLFIDAERAFSIALAVLVASCPCALSLATPATFTAALNAAAKSGIIIKNSLTLDKLPHIERIVFDKTGTLTQGNFQLQEQHLFHPDSARVWGLCKTLERNSTHPIAWYFSEQAFTALPLHNIQHHSGAGVSGEDDEHHYLIGSAEFIRSRYPQHTLPSAEHVGTQVYLADEQGVLALFVFADPLRNTSPAAIASLQKDYQLSIASGDQRANVEHVAQALNIREAQAEMSPADKLAYLKSLRPAKILMVGDGINDAPTLAAADLSMAVNRANPLSQTQADIVCLHHGPEALPYLFRLARRCQRIIRQNLTWAVVYNLSVIPLALLGYLTPWIAAIGMSASSLLVVYNATRLNRETI